MHQSNAACAYGCGHLCAFAASPEFSTVAAKISVEGRRAQEPITAAGCRILDGTGDMVLTAKSLAMNPKDPPGWEQFATHSREVSESVKALLAG